MSAFKNKLLDCCKENISKKRELLLLEITAIKEAMGNETKSSAGDKHETARARMQFEEEKLKKQLMELNEQAETLDKIDPSVSSISIGFASLVETDRADFFIAIPLGKLEINRDTVYVISSVSPLAMKMKGLEKGGRFEFNNLTYTILNVN